MRRGLKLDGRDPGARKDYRSTMFPDEEGTETPRSGISSSLKRICSTMFPDEEGTETPIALEDAPECPGSTMFPDEEGTETRRLLDSPSRWSSSTMFPDEEGTETWHTAVPATAPPHG